MISSTTHTISGIIRVWSINEKFNTRRCEISATCLPQISVLLVEQTTWDPSHLHWSCVFVCVCWRWLLPNRSVVPSDVLLYTLIIHNSMGPTHTQLAQMCVCVCVKTCICIVARLYESSEKPQRSSVLREISHAVSRWPWGILCTFIKQSKKGSKFNGEQLKRDKRKALLIN